MAYIDELLSRDEQILYIARQHLFVLISRVASELILIAVLVLAGFVSLQAFGSQYVNGIAIGQAVLLTCGAISALLLASMALDYLRWQNAQYVVTDRRVILLEGVFNKKVIDSSLEKINDVVLSQSWLGRILGFGDLEILTASDEAVTHMERINHPIAFKRAMLEAKHHYDRGYGYLDLEPVASYAGSGQQMGEIDLVLSELAALRDRGILSSDEFEAKKRELLSRI